MDEGNGLRASDIMSGDVVTVHPDMSIEELGRLFIEKDISGAPVLDDGGNLFGIVTENDLISQEKRFHIPTIIRIFDALIPLESSAKVEKEIKRMAASKVSDICSRDVLTVDQDTPVREIATIMSERKIHLIPVVAEGRIVGIIGKKDIIRSLSGAGD